MVRRYVPVASIDEHLAAGWRVVYEAGGGGHPIVRPVGAVVRSVIATDVPCPRCRAVPGKRCTGPGGAERDDAHEARERAADMERRAAR